ncbi:hypothetical protein FSP39_013348 [Pinctada imbricata]|uniref:C2H2-type domain-containing protein n=1 Tax=Pinctada imbricata TaxID=66713 RepID=A0AA88YER7_PINIB|nr:hypothetical protein FSP39_013348 [Pinctada imbricata]
MSPTPGPSAAATADSPSGTTHQYCCRRCHEAFSSRRDLYNHNMRQHTQQGGGALQPSPYIRGQEPWVNNQALRDVNETNASHILQRHQEGSVTSTYNLPLTNDFSVHEIMEAVEEIYDRQQHAFRLNLNFGLILVNTETGEYRYFIPYSNESLFQRPIYISRRRDLEKLRKRLDRFNIMDYILQQRPNTKWKPVLITNVHFHLYSLNYPLGTSLHLPNYIASLRSIVSLDKDEHNGQPFQDNLCAFRCLAVHRHNKTKLETYTRNYFKQWMDYLQSQDEKEETTNSYQDFVGVGLDQMADFEKCFAINVNIYDLKEDGLAQSIYKSRCQFSETMQLNMYQHHLSYISNFNAYATKYQCRTCDRHFYRICNMYRHQKICTGRTAHQFPGGFYTAPKTIFDKLGDFGIMVPKKDRLFPWFLVYDFEAMLLPVQGEESDKLKWTSKHVPISVSVCSNVENYITPHCIVNPNIDDLVKEMVDHMESIAAAGAELAREKFKGAYEELEAKINDPVSDLGFQDREPTADEVSDRAEALSDLQEELDAYCKQMICLGFNSANYDLNLIKSHIAKYLNLDQVNLFTVKRNNQYACLATNTLKFLDITSYLSPGINYAKFLKAFDVVEDKGFFPYDWLDHIEKLEYPQLPPHAAFYSALKDHNISSDEYRFCQKVWKDNGMCTFKDFLVWYNNLDVGPFVTAVQNLQKYYFERHIDIFKVSISVPGLARQMLFKCGHQAGASFALCNDNNKDLYYTIKDNIIGGPSIIFNRYHQVGKTNIRNDPSKPCKKIVGFDANALYLFCIGQPMPTGPFVRRCLEEQFKPNKTEKYMLAYHWLNWLNHSSGLNIVHKLNQGQEKRVGKYPVDGFDEDSNTIYQFHGCYWHGHRCWLTKSQHGKEKWEAIADKRAKKTERSLIFLNPKATRWLKCESAPFAPGCVSTPD